MEKPKLTHDIKEVFDLFMLTHMNYQDDILIPALQMINKLFSIADQIPKDTPEFFSNKHVRKHAIRASDLRKDIPQQYDFKAILPMHISNPYGKITEDGTLQINLKPKKKTSVSNSEAPVVNNDALSLDALPKCHNLIYHKKWNYITLVELMDIQKNNPAEFQDYLTYVNRQLRACNNLNYLLDQKHTINVQDNQIPIALKNLYWQKGQVCTNSSKMLQNFIPYANSTVAQRLVDHNFHLIPTHNDSFACGAMGNDCNYHHIVSPWFRDQEPLNIGGSSSGVAGMIAARIVTAGIGSDTGGSTRAPAAFGGIVGYKPSYGLIPRSGVIELNSELDTPSILAATVKDAQYVFNILRGQDGQDNTIKDDIDIKPVSNKVIGLLHENKYKEMGISDAVNKIKNHLQTQGYTFVNIDIKFLDYTLVIYAIFTMANLASVNHRFHAVLYGDSGEYDDLIVGPRNKLFSPTVKKRMLIGKYLANNDNKSIDQLDEYHNYGSVARKLLYLIYQDIQCHFEKIDFILSPVTTNAPMYRESYNQESKAGYLVDLYTIYVNLACMCAISIPVNLHNGAPVAIQLSGQYGTDNSLLELSTEIDKLFNFYKNYSPIKAPVAK